MKVAITRPALVALLEKVSKVAPTSKTVPVLTYVKMTAADNYITLAATDLMSTLVLHSGVTVVKEEGAVLLPVHEVLTALKSSDAGGVAVVDQPGGVLVRAGATTWAWKTLGLEQFPPVSDIETAVTHTIPRESLLKALRVVKSAAARDSYSAALEQVGIRNGHVQAADGIRYHSVEVPGTDLLDVGLPLSFVDELCVFLTHSRKETIDLGVTANKQAVVVRNPGTTLSTLVKQVDFPNVTSAFLVPVMGNQHPLKVSREALEGAVRRVRILADPESSAVRLRMSGSSLGEMEVSALSRSGAWASEKVKCDWVGPDRWLTLHHGYLSQLLAVFEGKELTLRLGDDAKHKPSPVLIIEDGRAGVLMQSRVDWLT